MRLARRHAGGRLVEQQDLRIARQRNAELQLFLVAVGQRGAAASASSQGRSRRGGLEPHRGTAPPSATRNSAAPAMRQERRLHILEDGELREDVGALKRAAHAHAADAVRRHAGDVAPVEQHPPRGGLQVPGDEVEEGRFAGAIGSDDRRDLARLDSEATSATALKPAKDLLRPRTSSTRASPRGTARQRRSADDAAGKDKQQRQQHDAQHQRPILGGGGDLIVERAPASRRPPPVPRNAPCRRGWS